MWSTMKRWKLTESIGADILRTPLELVDASNFGMRPLSTKHFAANTDYKIILNHMKCLCDTPHLAK
jgi:hypothetical protein